MADTLIRQAYGNSGDVLQTFALELRVPVTVLAQVIVQSAPSHPTRRQLQELMSYVIPGLQAHYGLTAQG